MSRIGSVVALVLVAGLMWHCGGERVMVEVDEQVGQPLSKLAVQDNASGAVVVASVQQDDAPVSGAMVEFARSVAGQVAEYAWSGMTDEDGRVRLEIAGDATGYYQARASQDGRVIGLWTSIPINAGDEVVVNLPIGGQFAHWWEGAGDEDVSVVGLRGSRAQFWFFCFFRAGQFQCRSRFGCRRV